MKILIVGSAPVDREQLLEAAHWSDHIIAADGGAHHLQEVGVTTFQLLGDMDSFSGGVPDDSLRFPAEKNFTDLEAALHCAQSANPEEVCVLGCTGGRLDHFLSSIMLLFAFSMPIRLLDRQNRIQGKREAFVLTKKEHRYVSLIPLDEMVLTIRGAKYDLDQRSVSPYESLGVSNEWRQEQIEVDFSGGRLIVVESSDL